MAQSFELSYNMSNDLEPTQEIVIERLGPLYGKGGQFKDAFSGKIKVETLADRAALANFLALNLDYVYENTQPGAPEDCGDERPATTFAQTVLKPLGPQNMGGTSTNALLWGLTAERHESHPRMIAGLNAAYIKAGVDYRPGGHCAEGAHGFNCGCAAIDLMPDVIAVATDFDKTPAHRWLTRVMLGPEFYSRDAYRTNLSRYRELSKRLATYLPPDYQNSSLDLMRKLSPDIDPVNTRVGEHMGLAVVVNNVADSRLSQDVLAAMPSKNDRVMEAFGVDIWYVKDLAQKLFPDDIFAQKEFATGRVMYDAAALMAITDGSLELLVRKTS